MTFSNLVPRIPSLLRTLGTRLDFFWRAPDRGDNFGAFFRRCNILGRALNFTIFVSEILLWPLFSCPDGDLLSVDETSVKNCRQVCSNQKNGVELASKKLGKQNVSDLVDRFCSRSVVDLQTKYTLSQQQQLYYEAQACIFSDGSMHGAWSKLTCTCSVRFQYYSSVFKLHISTYGFFCGDLKQSPLIVLCHRDGKSKRLRGVPEHGNRLHPCRSWLL